MGSLYDNLIIPAYHKDIEEYFKELELFLQDLVLKLKTDVKVVSQGDSASYDYTLSDFTTDGTWHVLDLSSKLPDNAKLVILGLELKDDAAGSTISFREYGNTNPYNVSTLGTQVNGVSIFADLLVFCPNRKIEYKASNTTFSTINLVIKGYFN